MNTAAQNGIHKLYHYQGGNLDYLKDTLINQRVYFSNPRNFNDPWDCNPYFEPAVDDAESRRKWGERLDPHYQALPTHMKEALRSRWAGNWYDFVPFLRQTIQSLSGHVRRISVERWRIYCLTPHANSLLMWAHYAEKHQGLCLEFDTATPQIGRAFQVLYSDTLPVIVPDSFNDERAIADAILLTKSQEWAYEQEYRMLARDEGSDPAFSARTEKDFLSLAPGVLTAVVAGSNADFAAIKEVMKEFGGGIALKKAVRIPNRYHLDVIDHT